MSQKGRCSLGFKMFFQRRPVTTDAEIEWLVAHHLRTRPTTTIKGLLYKEETRKPRKAKGGKKKDEPVVDGKGSGKEDSDTPETGLVDSKACDKADSKEKS